MPGTLRVLWTIRTSTTFPRPILRCSRCDAPRAFESSGKFRLNANGKRLDAWLVYRCATCGNSWNRPIFERRRRNGIGGEVLDALLRNDPGMAAAVARDTAGLARWTTRFADSGDDGFEIDRTVLEGLPDAAERLAITVVAQGAGLHRLDRLLAAGLGISRSRMTALGDDGRIVVDGSGRRSLARTTGGQVSVTIELAELPDAAALAGRAGGAGGAGGAGSAGSAGSA